MTSGEQYVMTAGAALMQMWSADNWDMRILEVCANAECYIKFLCNCVIISFL